MWQRWGHYAHLMRIDKPIGTLLLLWPTLWGLWFAGAGRPAIGLVFIFVLGTTLMRAAGCVVNDYADRHFDGHVERTQHRPLATQAVSETEALVLTAVLCLLAAGLLPWLNSLARWLALPALFLAVSYPFTKRFLALPQAYLGIAFGFGIPMAFAAQTGQVPWTAWVLLVANVCWTLAYDTQYAMVDREDDIHLGIRTSALTFGRFDVAAVMLCYGLFLGLMAWMGWVFARGIWYTIGLLVAAGCCAQHYVWIRERERMACFRAFLHNNWVGMSVFVGTVLDFALG